MDSIVLWVCVPRFLPVSGPLLPYSIFPQPSLLRTLQVAAEEKRVATEQERQKLQGLSDSFQDTIADVKCGKPKANTPPYKARGMKYSGVRKQNVDIKHPHL